MFISFSSEINIQHCTPGPDILEVKGQPCPVANVHTEDALLTLWVWESASVYSTVLQDVYNLVSKTFLPEESQVSVFKDSTYTGAGQDNDHLSNPLMKRRSKRMKKSTSSHEADTSHRLESGFVSEDRTIDQDLEISNQDKKYVYELMLGSVVILLYGTKRLCLHTQTYTYVCICTQTHRVLCGLVFTGLKRIR